MSRDIVQDWKTRARPLRQGWNKQLHTYSETEFQTGNGLQAGAPAEPQIGFLIISLVFFVFARQGVRRTTTMMIRKNMEWKLQRQLWSAENPGQSLSSAFFNGNKIHSFRLKLGNCWNSSSCFQLASNNIMSAGLALTRMSPKLIVVANILKLISPRPIIIG